MYSKNTKHNENNCEIAVIGVGCIYPGATSPLQFWENILARRQQFREIPEQRLPGKEYYDPDPTIPDKSYQNKASVIDGYKFNWLDRRIPKSSYESTDIVHWLALDTAMQALCDTGIDIDKIPKDTTGVIFGNSLTGEFTRSNYMRLRWPYIRKVLRASLKKKGLTRFQEELEATMETYYKSVFSPVTEDTLAGGLANTIAGRVCNFLDLHGGGYIVDGACSSSLLAVINAANALELRQMDMVIAGGVDVSLDTFELIGFAKTGALAKEEMRVYDKNGNGFIPGEGCGVVIMKRLDDAVRDNNIIYAIIKGWGISSDGKGGITAPSAKGQSMALQRAYRKAGFETNKLSFIEGHGTGTTVGDKIELEGISIALDNGTAPILRTCGVTSLKSIVGHTKAAAGVGAFIKTVIALNRRVLPPTSGIREFNPIFNDKAKALYPIIRGQVLDPESTIYAGVSAMGFGGINSHVILQSGDSPQAKFQPSIKEEQLMVSNQTHELFLFTATDINNLTGKVNEALELTKGISYAELADFAAENNKKIDLNAKLRASLIAGTPAELTTKLQSLLKNITERNIEKYISAEGDTVIWGIKKDSLRIGGLFPGQGSQQINMALKLVKRYPWAKEIVNHADEIFKAAGAPRISDYIYKATERAANPEEENKWKTELKQTNIAQPAITLASLIWLKHLERLGLKLTAVTGHSLGELMAFQTSGFIDKDTLLSFAAFRGKMMSEQGSGTMASLICSKEVAEGLIENAPGYAIVANLNSPEQTVISGEEKTIDFIIESAATKNIKAIKLPVSAAFHSKLVADTAEAIKNYPALKKKLNKEKQISLISSVTGKSVDENVDLNSYFSEQAISQVNFLDTINNIKKECDVLIEIGPGKVLSGLANSIHNEIKCFSSEAQDDNDLSLQVMLANLFVMGMDINTVELYKNRLIRDFIPDSKKEFLVNPCERPFPEMETEYNLSGEYATNGILDQHDTKNLNFDEYWSVRADFIKELIKTDLQYYSSKEINGSPGNRILSSGHPPVPTINKNIEKPATESVRSVVHNKIQNITGFPSANFKEEMKLLDDFNLDSIKAGSLLNDIFKIFQLQGKLNAANFSNASLNSIISEIEKNVATLPLNSELSNKSGNIGTEDSIYKLIAEKTGFPREALKPEYRLLNDLNLDSIKAGSLLAEIIKNNKLQGKIEPSAYANSSISEIIDTIKGFEGEGYTAESKLSQQDDIQHFLYNQIEEKTGFPAQNLKHEFRLLDDLNLDSIKANSLVTTVFKKYNVLGKFEVSKYANAALSQIINDIKAQTDQSITEKPSIPTADENKNWVSSYTVHAVKDPLTEQGSEAITYWNGKTVGLISSGNKEKIIRDLHKSLTNKLGNVQHLSYKELMTCNTGFDNLLILVPDSTETGDLELVVGILSTVAGYQPQKNIDIGFIQFGDGYFGKNPADKSKTGSVFSAAGFASSLHLERPNCKICVIEFDRSLPLTYIEGCIMNEFEQNNSFKIIGYDKNKERVRLEYERSIESPSKKRDISITNQDVFIVTGGAKGITAECALSFARKYNCRMALVGSSPFKGEKGEIKTILEKYAGENLTAQYFSCDISNPGATKNLISEVEVGLGKITGIIHGAGKNLPRKAENVSSKDAMDEISPKIKGAINLYSSVNAHELKYFIAFTSIIGVTGMPGNSWYAFSNEMLDLYLRRIRNISKIETIALAYSIWSEVGMGERMGSTKTLANMGISAIPPIKGIEEFLRWTGHKADDQQIVIASRLGGLDTWNLKGPAQIDAGRFIENIISFEPGIELKVRTKLSEKTDLYLKDHDYKGSLLFPTVFGLEAMTQAVATITGNALMKSLRLENISLMRPIVVSKGGETEIEIKASILEDDNNNSSLKRIQVGISTEQTNFTVDHFSALFILGDTSRPDLSVPASGFSVPLAISPESDLYSWLLFQGPKFQLIDSLYDVSETQSVFMTKKPGNDGSNLCFPEKQIKPFILGNPLLRDTLLQSVQLSLTKKLVLPIAIERWEIYDIADQLKGGEVRCKLVNWDENTGNCDVVYLNSDNKIVERIVGYKIKAMESTSLYPEPKELMNLSTTLKSRFSEEISKIGEHIEPKFDFVIYKHKTDFNLLNKETRRSVESEVLNSYTGKANQLNLKVGENTLKWAENGKPSLANCDINISISHSKSILLMILGSDMQGCDIEKIEKRDPEEWKTLFDFKYTDIISHMQSTGIDSDLNSSCTRLWGVCETCMKAHAFIPPNISIENQYGNAIIFRVTHNKKVYQILSFPIDLLPNNKYVVSFIVKPKVNDTAKSNDELAGLDNIFDEASGKFTTQFLTTFKDCRGFYGKTYFTDFPIWMGNLREYILTPVKKQLLRDLGSGEFGMVTNDSTINICNEADTLDKITGRLWITEKSDLKNSLIDLGYEWYKHTDDGKLEKLADCILSTTWVKIEKRGIVKISPIPSYFFEFLESHQRNIPNEPENIQWRNQYPQLSDLGKTLYKSSSTPRPEILLLTKEYHTGIYNSNTVGNLYYSNYYDWQAKNIESYFYNIYPDIFLKNGKTGEYICLKSNTIHLQEAMPFEDIEVHMYLEKLYNCGMKFYFEFYSKEHDQRRKLAYGYNILLWAKRLNEFSLPVPEALPESIIQVCLSGSDSLLKVVK